MYTRRKSRISTQHRPSFEVSRRRTLGARASKLSDVLPKGFVVLSLLLFTGGLLPVLRQESSESLSTSPTAFSLIDPTQANDTTRLVWLVIYGITLVLIFTRWKQFVYIVTREKLLLLLVGIVLVSVLWSTAPEVTLRRSVGLIGTTLFGVYLAMRFDLSELLRLLAWTLGIAALLSLVFALILPSYGVFSDIEGEAWQGIYEHKNALGRAMTLSVVVFLLLALSSYRHRWVAWLCFGLSAGLVLFSASAAAIVISLSLLVLLPFYKALRWRYTFAVPFFTLAVLMSGAVAMWVLSNAESVLSVLGKDVTLTGRTEVWNAVLEMIWRRPWLGYGYGTFWQGWEGESAHVWLSTIWLGFVAPHAHNGFLDLWLDIGLLGVLVFAVGFLLAFLRAIIWARLSRTTEGLWPLTYLTFMFMYSLTESAILKNNSAFWALYVAVVLSTTLVRYVQVPKTAHIDANLSKVIESRRARSSPQKSL